MVNKSNSRNGLGIYTFLLAVAGLSQAATTTVGPGACYDFSTIQAGIDVAVDGDMVLVAPGEYIITEPITFRGKAITVKSETGADETTIRMGTPTDINRGSVVVFENNETDSSVLDGFTIMGGTGCRIWAAKGGEAPRFWWQGGGICLDNASSGTMRDCAIVQNRADAGGGVSVFSRSSAILTNCIINENSATDPEGAGAGVLCWHTSSVTMTECIIRGNSSMGVGGGVCCAFDASMAMTNCIITGNSARDPEGAGGGVICWDSSSVTMAECIIRDNSTMGPGGGVCCGSLDSSMTSSVTMTNCEIMGNTAAKFGGGIYGRNALATLTNCVIAQNTGGWGGGGVGTSGGSFYGVSFIQITNCTITGNSGAVDAGGGGVVSYGRGSIGAGSITITNSIVCRNTSAKGPEISLMGGEKISVSYSNVAGGQTRVNVEGGSTLDWGPGNIDADPYFADPTSDEYYLKSQASRWDSDIQTWVQDDITSPCIDAGDPMSPIGWEPFPNGGFVNMGAYGGTPNASKSYFGEPTCETIVAGDINGDGQVNRADLEIMALHWTDDEPLSLP